MANTAYSPYWSSYTLGSDRSGLNYVYTRLARRTPRVKELLDTLIGAAAGSAALSSHKRVAHSRTELGGVRTMETYYDINRVSAAADVTALKAMIMTDSRIATPANRAGTNWKA